MAIQDHKLLLRVTHGSTLYGLNHAGSDTDVWEVYANAIPSPAKAIKQTITGKEDVTRMNLSTFMLYADRSSHQVLEAMFAPDEFCEVDLLRDFRRSYTINTATFVPLYKRTIKAFALSDSLKSKRHAVRMAYNLSDGLFYGRFNPNLTEQQREAILGAEAESLEAFALESIEEDE